MACPFFLDFFLAGLALRRGMAGVEGQPGRGVGGVVVPNRVTLLFDLSRRRVSPMAELAREHVYVNRLLGAPMRWTATCAIPCPSRLTRDERVLDPDVAAKCFTLFWTRRSKSQPLYIALSVSTCCGRHLKGSYLISGQAENSDSSHNLPPHPNASSEIPCFECWRSSLLLLDFDSGADKFEGKRDCGGSDPLSCYRF